ncbi:hypothetical protein, partial [Armatimonas sp.]|uniref:hypothetical protein n=1 Tax=Armatimonas sp. TaxID=1872638 RepID=UPI00286B8DED
MNQKKKKLLAPAPEPQLDILATPRNRRLFLGAVIVIYGMGYAFSVWGKMHFGASLRRALVDSLTTMLLVIALQAPVWFW